MNPWLAGTLAIKSLLHHRIVTFVTIAGVAVGMSVIATIVIVDHNTQISETRETFRRNTRAAEARQNVAWPAVERVVFRGGGGDAVRGVVGLVPTQRGEVADLDTATAQARPVGEADYQAMRLAVRLASFLAFGIGAIIVFYTMRYSVAGRSRELALLLCLGEHRRNVVLSLVAEALVLGALGTAVGVFFAIPGAGTLLGLGVTTTGRFFAGGFDVPRVQLAVFAVVGVLTALSGVIGPARAIHRLEIPDVLQPRFASERLGEKQLYMGGYGWLALPLVLVAYLLVRPFLVSWMSVAIFFLAESLFVMVFAVALLWWVKPVLKMAIRAVEVVVRRVLPLETLLTAKRMRLTSHQFVFSITGIVLVFAMFTALHTITASLKHEIRLWAGDALLPFAFFQRTAPDPIDTGFVERLETDGVSAVRLSDKADGVLPMRLIHSADLNRYRRRRGEPTFGPGQTILTKTLARRFGVGRGDRLEVTTGAGTWEFTVTAVSDAWGAMADRGQYVDIKSYALFSEGNPAFEHNLETTLGDYLVLRAAGDDPVRLPARTRAALDGVFEEYSSGRGNAYSRTREIDKDFLIFDFILSMTVLLAGIGLVNSSLIQVHARAREFSMFRVMGMTTGQVGRLLVMEGFLVGAVSGMIGLALGGLLGVISVSFLDRFTLFALEPTFTTVTIGLTLIGAVGISCVSAIYPAFVATQSSSAESLHYE